MSNRRGRRGGSYATRVASAGGRQRQPVPRQRGRAGAGAGGAGAPAGGDRAPWHGLRWPVVGLAVAAEAGHLVAGYLQWPYATATGIGQVVIAGLLGVAAAALLFGGQRWWPAVGGAAALASPLWWLIGAPLGAAPYRELPVLAGAGITLLDLALAALLVVITLRAATPALPAPTRPA